MKTKVLALSLGYVMFTYGLSQVFPTHFPLHSEVNAVEELVIPAENKKELEDMQVIDVAENEEFKEVNEPQTPEIKEEVKQETPVAKEEIVEPPKIEEIPPEEIQQEEIVETSPAPPVSVPQEQEKVEVKQTPPPPAPVTPPSPPEVPQVQSWTIFYQEFTIPFKNGGQANGQAIIDSNPYGVASTWGGAEIFSGVDGLSTHFIGHNEGAFTCFVSAKKGEVVQVTDGGGVMYYYTITQITLVDPSGIERGTGKDLFYNIINANEGERIVIQTCIDNIWRLILFCY
ncbi:sortase family protein [Pilibacter termitis]|nr:hypothetical protein [Pilibacter termitis]